MSKHFWIKFWIFYILAFTIILIVVFYNDLSIYFAKDNYKGEFFKVILASIGGFGVLYGLYLNSERIKQGNEQLEQQEENNTNTRFKDAVSLLGNENPAVVIGGIHTLNQIAVDNIKYREIVADILCSNIREKSTYLVNKSSNSGFSSIMQLIVNYLFTETYYNIELNLSYAKFENIKFNDINSSKIIFNNCIFNKCIFKQLLLNNDEYNNIKFNNCTISAMQFISTSIFNFQFNKCTFEKEFSINKTEFIDIAINTCEITNIKIIYGVFSGLTIDISSFSSGEIVNTKFKDVSLIYDNNFEKIKFVDTDLVEEFPNNTYSDCENSFIEE